MMEEFDTISGCYEGSGQWNDAVGKSEAYRIVQTNRRTSDGCEIVFRHDFDDGTVIEARVVLSGLVPHIFRVAVSGNAVGHGYWAEDGCHYHMKVGDAFVEVSYRPQADGLNVHGSSTKNAEGNYIVWGETLRRMSD